MRAFLFLSVAAVLTLAACNNKYGDDPTKQGLARPAATPIPTATPIPEKE